MLYFHILVQDMNCVAAIGVVHFSVRGFGCALFYFRKEYENMRAKKFSAVVAAATAVVVMLTGCGEGEQSSNTVNSESSAMSGEVSNESTVTSNQLVSSDESAESSVESVSGDVVSSDTVPVEPFSYSLCNDFKGNVSAMITSYNGTESEITLPITEFQGYKVRVIGTEAFKNTGVKKIVVPEGYTSYEEGAFNDCTELEELYLPDSMEDFMKSDYSKITDYFQNCMKLTKVQFMENTINMREELIGNVYSSYNITADCLSRVLQEYMYDVKKSKNGTFAGTATIPVYFGDSTGNDEQVKIDLSDVELDISGADENGEEWSSEKFFEKLKERYQEDFPTLNGYAIFVLKDGKYTQVAYSAELDITKYKEITDEDYTDKYCIGDAVVAKWDYR